LADTDISVPLNSDYFLFFSFRIIAIAR
jgi:hypothetical protein